MFTKTLLALSLIAGSTFALNSYQPLLKTSPNPLQITQLSQQIDSIARNITVKVNVAENEGSGILIAKDNDTYTVITNASVNGKNYTIQTPDGMEHEAIVIEDNTENDLVLLEFNSDNDYQTATIGNSNNITEGETVIAAGFPESKGELLVTEGKISLVTEKPLNKGYSIGFTNETVQGMSGGVLLNANAEVIGVLGKGKGAILDTAYDYADGTTPNRDEIATYREHSFSIPIANIANLSPQLAQLVPGESNPDIPQQPEVTPAPTEYTGIVKTVDDIAQQITVRIATAELDSYGSGVIIARDGNTYYVATVRHNFPEGTTNSYQIVTPDGESHQLDLNTVKKSDAYDFAIFSFTSDNDYTVATIGNYTVAANDDRVVFVSGFPGMYAPNRIITGGKVRQQDETSFAAKDSFSFASTTTDRPALLYSNISYKGMSGGAVLDSEGRVIGYTKAIEINPQSAPAYNNRGITYKELKQYDSAIADYTKAIEINPQYAQAYNNRGITYNDLKQYDSAIADYNQSIEINPLLAEAYSNRGITYSELKQYDSAIADYNQSIEINPQYAPAYNNRGNTYRDLKQYDSAIADYTKVISLNPQYVDAYNNRGLTYKDLRQYDSAIADYTKAIDINPQYAIAHYNRGNNYSDLKQYDSAIADYTKAIDINPQLAEAHWGLDWVNKQLNDTEEARTNLEKARQLLISQNRIADAETVASLLAELP